MVRPKKVQGRPKSPERDAFLTRPSMPLGDVIRDNADELGMAYGAYIAMLVAHALGMPEEAPKMPQRPDQQELPLTKTA